MVLRKQILNDFVYTRYSDTDMDVVYKLFCIISMVWLWGSKLANGHISIVLNFNNVKRRC